MNCESPPPLQGPLALNCSHLKVLEKNILSSQEFQKDFLMNVGARRSAKADKIMWKKGGKMLILAFPWGRLGFRPVFMK